MSAFLVNPEHIGVLAKYAADNKCCVYGQHYNTDLLTAKKISDCLSKANIDSINTRYPNDADPKGDILYMLECGDYTTFEHKLTLSELSNMVNCLEYQCNEVDDWYQSQAFKVLTSIREKLLKDLTKGCDMWDFSKEKAV